MQPIKAWAELVLSRDVTQGEARGRALGEATVTLRLLNRRCGPISEATTARIQVLPLQQLESSAEVLLDFNGPADLTS